MHVLRGLQVRGVRAVQRAWAKQGLTNRAAALRKRNIPVRWRLRTGAPPAEIVKAAAEEQANLIVMGTNGRQGMARLLVDSVAERVVRTAPCPVLTVGIEGSRFPAQEGACP